MKNDPRFKAVANEKDRRKWFDAYCSALVTSSTQSAASLKKKTTPKESYLELLMSKVKVSTMWEEFSRKNRNEPRLTAVDMRTREKMFFDYQRELKRNEAQRRKEAEKKFSEFLNELNISKNDSWNKVTIRHFAICLLKIGEKYD